MVVQAPDPTIGFLKALFKKCKAVGKFCSKFLHPFRAVLLRLFRFSLNFYNNINTHFCLFILTQNRMESIGRYMIRIRVIKNVSPESESCPEQQVYFSRENNSL